MVTKTRFDYVELKVKKTDEGFILDSPNVARTGILTYRNDDGSMRRELRLPEDVFHTDALNSFKGKPVTVDHPKGLVTHADIDKYQIGTMLSAGRQDGDNVLADIVIHQPGKIGERRQLSLGYNVDLDETPGEWNGQKYDAIQRNIRVNHLSVVKSARAGAQARLNMDSDEEPLLTEVNQMPKIRLDSGIEYEAAPEVIVAVEKLRIDATALADVVKTKDTAIATLTGERDTLKARVDGLPAEIEKARTDAAAEIEAHNKLVAVATKFNVDSKDKTADQIKHAVIQKFNKDFDPKDKSAEYVQAAFDIAVSSFKTDAIATQRQTVNSTQKVNNDGDDKKVDPREAYIATLGSNGTKAKE